MSTVVDLEITGVIGRLLAKIEEERLVALISGPPGFGLSRAAALFCAQSPQTRVFRDVEESCTAADLRKVLYLPNQQRAHQGDLFTPHNNAPDISYRAAASFTPTLANTASRGLLVLDDCENFASRDQFRRFVTNAVGRLRKDFGAVVLIGGDGLHLPTSDVASIPERSYVTPALTEHVKCYPFSYGMMLLDDVTRIAALYGADDFGAVEIMRLVKKGRLQPSHMRIKNAAARWRSKPDPAEFRRSVARDS